MSVPEPKYPLEDACSVLFNNTLYAYSAQGFQSLRLEEGAEWEQLEQGEKVTGGVCVGSTPGEPSTAGLFIVGGKGTSADYAGLQKYTYSTGKWEAPKLKGSVVQERLSHSAIYINSEDAILVYAGHQDGSQGPSSETFLIGASAPHAVGSYPTNGAPSTTNPILLRWSETEAAMIGGSETNKQVMLFRREGGWFDSGTSLAEPLPNVKAMIVTGEDGSQSLYTFDLTQSPNKVQRLLLAGGGGVPVPNAAPVTKAAKREKEAVSQTVERDPIEGNWPEYNATLAPTSTRSKYAMAHDYKTGMAVFTGGNPDDVLAIFDAKENSWLNATEMLADQKVLALDTSSTVSSTSSRTSTSTSSSTLSSTSATLTSEATSITSTSPTASPTAPVAAATSSSDDGPGTNTVLAIVLSSIFGLAILLFVIYWCIQRKRSKQLHQETGHMRRSSGASVSDEKSGIGYASDRQPPNPVSASVFRGHQAQGSESSMSSMAILMGRANQQKPGHAGTGGNLSVNTTFSKRNSEDSTFRAFKSTIGKPIPHPATQNLNTVPPPRPQPPTYDEKGVSFAANTPEPRPRNPPVGLDRQGSTRRSSGWNRYWSGGSALNLLGFGGGQGNGNTKDPSRRTTIHSDRSSHYSDQYNRMTQDSATVPPLQVYEPRASFSRVAARSPTIAHTDEKVKEGLAGQIEMQRPVSAVSSVSGYSSGIPASVHEAWDPTAATKPWGANRAPSSAYSASIYTTPLAPASYTAKAPAQSAPVRQQQQQQVVRDDVSWLNLGDR